MKDVKLAVLNMDGIVVSATDAFQNFLGIDIKKSQIRISDLLDVTTEDILKNSDDTFSKQVCLKNDHDANIHLFAHSLKDEGNRVLALIITISDTVNKEGSFDFDDENLCHLDRLTHIGKLSANIAHEIGNPLGGILAAARGLKRKLLNDDEKEYIDMIIDDIGSIKNTIESLRDFARRSKPNFISTDLRQILKRTLFLVMPEIQKKNVEFVEQYPDGALNIKADPEQLRQVFLNILLNAVAAVGHNGTLTLIVSSSENRMGKSCLLISIKDDGIGMSDEEKTHIFKPFFTTKAKGLGLGLCVTKKIVEDHDGYIEVESQKDAGTQFKIYLLKE